MSTPAVALLLALALGLGFWLGRRRSAPAPAAPAGPQRRGGAPANKSEELYSVAAELEAVFQASAKPADVLAHPVFERGVALLRQPEWTVDELLDYYRGDSIILASLALDALTRRDDRADVRQAILESINDFAPWNRFFALRLLAAKTPADEPLIGRVLLALNESWAWNVNARLLGEFLRKRVEAGETLRFGSALAELQADGPIDGILARLPADIGGPLVEELSRWRSRHVDHALLNSVGRVWSGHGDGADGPVLEHDDLLADLARVESTLLEPPRRSVVLVGEHGVGKTTLVRLLAQRWAGHDGIVFEAGYSELIAGQIYIGELERRMRELIDKIGGRKVVWFVPDLHTLVMAGRHKYSPVGALDIMLPAIEAGRIVVVGETTPAAYERLVQAKVRVKTAFEVVRVAPLANAPTRRLVDCWADARVGGEAGFASATRAEALLLAQQYLGDQAAPGNVLKLVELTRRRLQGAGLDGALRIDSDDLITTLSQLTGLPASILDERQGLDLEALRRFFEQRIKGQPDAVDCLLECVAMIKAGTNDPKRPLGVFLFAGPTGTGKTELAKTLAAYLFGAEDRLLRLDMSELQTPESLDRIVGGAERDEHGGALVDQIRKQPFAVVLLDEFEKAHPNVWDVFLQLFDDGRLTDRTGSTADFRNAIVILTSNLGSTIQAGAGLGFQDESGNFSAARVIRVVERAFRKEFLNRLDRVVVFRPLGRDTMREILHKELAAAFQRRGLRNRAWAVEWDASAVELLLREGFTVDLGARPLRRAIEQRLLAPLSMTIVNHQYPAGDQFLFVRAEGDELVVDFVDPDAGVAEGEDEAVPSDGVATGGEHDGVLLERIALDPRGNAAEAGVLRSAHEELQHLVHAEPWLERKRDGLARMQRPAFWESPDRYETLGDVEYVDRIEAGLAAAGSLLDRLVRSSAGTSSPRDHYPRKMLGRLASQLFVLREACQGLSVDQPRDAFVQVEAWSDSGRPSCHAEAFARRVGGMYRKWADKRRMPVETVHEWGGNSREAYGVLLAISGYAAFPLLRHEHGLHVLEIPDEEGRGHRRAAVRVRVAGQPVVPPRGGADGLAAQARAAMEAQDGNVAIVRRYRETPSPLVRDAIRGWRSGRLDRVLEGDFDLIASVRGNDPETSPG